MRHAYLALVILVGLSVATTQTRYKVPADNIVRIVDAPPPPQVSVSPDESMLLLVDYAANPPLAMLAEPYFRLAGLRINGKLNCRQRTAMATGLTVISIADGQSKKIDLPKGMNFGDPVWSNDGKKIALTVDGPSGLELWIIDAEKGSARRIENIILNDVLGQPYEWLGDNSTLLVRSIPGERGSMPIRSPIPEGPITEEASGKQSPTWTYQDLLSDAYDEDVFEFLATSQLARVDVESGRAQRLGSASILLDAEVSPDNNCILVTRLMRPFSRRVPFYYFTRTVEVWDIEGRRVTTIAELPVSDEVPTQGVPTGPRSVQWQPLHPSKLLWLEAQDGGDPTREVPFREKLFTAAAPFKGKPAEVMSIQHRYRRFDWTGVRDEVWVTEYDRDRRWETVSHVSLASHPPTRRVLFDMSIQDVYKDPGRPVYRNTGDGTWLMVQAEGSVYLSGRGATPAGYRPFLDKYNIETGKKERVFLSGESSYESFVSFIAKDEGSIVVRSESPEDPPNYYE